MTSSEDKDRHDRLVKAFLGDLSAEEMDTQRRREYRQGYPKATAAEIQLLMDADDKAGYPPQGLGHARYIMRSSVGARLPAPTAKDFDDAVREIAATHRENQRENEALAVGMTFVNWDRRPAVLFEQGTYAVLAPGAPWTEVDRHDVFGASVLSQEEWRRVFRAYAPFDLRALRAKLAAGMTDRRPTPTVRGFDDAAREAAANQRENEALGAGMTFVEWRHHVPAVLIDGMAFVVVEPGDPWERVDRHDVFGAAFLSQDEWRRDFHSYAPLDLRELRAKVAAIHREERPRKERPLALAKTLAWVAEEIGDCEMGLWAAAMQHEVREELGALDELGRRQGTTH
jgi:hypothetical protein